ncbi:cybB cytochrome b-561 transmembrane protein [Legionella lansingensis]|uniref:Cytochrome b-561 transmembrane protein n=2 Tax=Legionella lansingensis TaxID=45067 RepID=A0A0W0VJK1_9GAMM|nr:cytochrome b [Legionella lansingensis]KTD20282.1 cytochrome b-561 transmembrane protein [Legionella lansingensis]SNV50308.1 cybB cytochrome b-561 transmembrane protein [Legionella lansingensis]
MSSHPIVSYSKGIKFIHWLVAVLVIVMLSFGFFLDDVPKQYQGTAYMMHKSTGLTILCLMVLRLIWVAYKGKPPLPEAVPRWEKFLTHFVQYSFYVFLILMPLTGWIMSVAADRVPSYFGLFNVPFPGVTPNEELSDIMNQAHKTIAWVLIILLSLHVAGALKHHFINKDDILLRMWPRRRRNKEFITQKD